MEEYNELEMAIYKIVINICAKLNINISAPPDEVAVISFFIIGLLFLCSMFVFSSAKHNKKAKSIKKRCTKSVVGKCVRIDSERTYRQDAADTYQDYAIIYFLINGIEYKTRALKWNINVGDEINVFYNPNNPNDNVIERDLKDGLKDNGFKGFLSFLKMILIFIILVVVIIICTEL